MTNRIDSYLSGTQLNLAGTATIQEGLTLSGVREQLFNWDAQEATLTAMGPSGFTEVSTHKAITRSDTGAVVGVVGTGYKIHGYAEWLTENVAKLLDTDDLVIRSAGTLNGGARAWVQVGTPEGIVGPGGIEFLPILGSYTSLDSSVSTIYKGNRIVVVCENTYAMALGESSETFGRKSIRHTRNSTFDVLSTREAVGLVFANADAFKDELEELLALKVNDVTFGRIASRVVAPTTDSDRSKAMAERKLGELASLWANDERVAPWRGTGFGALQALNTWRQHIATVKNVSRDERNMTRVMDGTGDKADLNAVSLIRELVGA